MTWFKVDDGLAGHPKAEAAGTRAMGLWVMAGSYASRYLTDGFVPDRFVAGYHYGAHDAGVLVSVGLWSRVEGGYLFHDWAQSNPTRAQVEDKRETDRKRKTRWRDASRDASRDAGVATPPTRPDPNTYNDGRPQVVDVESILSERPPRDDDLNAQGVTHARRALKRTPEEN